jgi:hypothetical protein
MSPLSPPPFPQWSSLTTWANQEPPLAGDTVVIPFGQSVLLDESPPKLFLLLVQVRGVWVPLCRALSTHTRLVPRLWPQGDLIFDRKDLSLDANYIFVYGGKFEVSTHIHGMAVDSQTIT